MLTLLLVVTVSPCLCADVQPVLGNSFTFPQNCKNDEEGKLLRSEPHGEVEVSVHQRGVWTPAPDYLHRVLQNSSIFFRRIFYNDSGVFVLRCGSREMRIQVTVLFPFNVTVKEGEKASLPCYFPTTDNKCVSARWEMNQQVVFEWNSCADKGNGTANGRLSRDFSLNLQQARKEDRGYYSCYKQNEDGKKERGNPPVVRLKVKTRGRDRSQQHRHRKSGRRNYKKRE